jgi:predicted Zn-dependent peptidase
MNALSHYSEYGEDYDALYEAAINSLTAQDIQSVLQAILAQGNFIEVTLAPQE